MLAKPYRRCPIVRLFIILLLMVGPSSHFAQAAFQEPKPAVQALLDQGSAAYDAGRFDDCLRLGNQALAKARLLKDKVGEATALMDIGRVYEETSRPQQALNLYGQALPLWRAIGDKNTEGVTLTNIGELYDGFGEPQKALGYFDQALPLNRAAGDKIGEAKTLNNIGTVYAGIGQPQQALTFFNQSLSLSRRIGDKDGQTTTLDNVATLYADAGQSQRALEFYNQVLPLRRQTRDKPGEATTLNNIGTVYQDMGQPKRALEFFNQALPLHHQAGDKDGEATTLSNIGGIYRVMGQPQKALEFAGQALLLMRAIGNKDGEAKILYNIAVAQAEQGQWPQPAEHALAALQILEETRTSLGGLAEGKESFLASHLDVYDFYVNLLLKHHNPIEAFAWAEKTKARALLDVMNSGKVDLSARLSQEEQGQEQALQQQAEQLNNQLVRAAMRDGGNSGRVATIKAQLMQNERQRQVFSDAVYARHPDLARQRAAKTATLEDVRQFLPPDTALLEYVTLHASKVDETMLFCITRENAQAKVTAYLIPHARDELSRVTENFRQNCADPDQPDGFKPAARTLFSWLVAPAARQLQGKKRLIVCPDGPLWNIPFQALLDKDEKGREQFLLQQYEITYAYSATAVQAAQQAKDDPQRAKPSRTLLAMANPDFGTAARFGNETEPVSTGHNDPRAIRVDSRALRVGSRAIRVDARGVWARDGALMPLPATQYESDAIGRDFPDAILKTRQAAQESTAKQQAGTFRYLHFATHGLFNDAAPMLSSIVLADPTPQSGEDGFLTAREIADLHLSAELVVLSACETGRGQKRDGEGIIGLTWALFVAGAPSQVVSQWSVDDASTARLMKVFYGQLKAGRSKGEALRVAELQLMADSRHAHPFFWAPFILVGDWR